MGILNMQLDAWALFEFIIKHKVKRWSDLMDIADSLYEIERKILYKELKPLFEALVYRDYAVVKGEALSQQIYGCINRRRSSDIDILIDKSNVKFIESELKKLGFRQQLPEDSQVARRNRVLCITYSHQIPSYHKEVTGFHLNVDINYDIFWGEYEGHRTSIGDFFTDTVEMNIYGISVKTLSVEKAFIQLILHHYKEMNSLYHLSHYNCIRTHMFRDIRDMIVHNKDILTPGTIHSLCDKYSIGTYIFYMVYYTALVFNDDYLDEIMKKLEKFRDERLINSFGLNGKERKRWMISFGERLDNNDIWGLIKSAYTDDDLRKVELGNSIFT